MTWLGKLILKTLVPLYKRPGFWWQLLKLLVLPLVILLWFIARIRMRTAAGAGEEQERKHCAALRERDDRLRHPGKYPRPALTAARTIVRTGAGPAQPVFPPPSTPRRVIWRARMGCQASSLGLPDCQGSFLTNRGLGGP